MPGLGLRSLGLFGFSFLGFRVWGLGFKKPLFPIAAKEHMFATACLLMIIASLSVIGCVNLVFF